MIFSKQTVKILKLSIPAALNSLLDMLMVLADLIMVGSLGASAIAGVGLGLQSVGFLYAFLSIFYVGTNAIVSRKFGAKEFNTISHILFSVGISAFFISLPIGVLLFLFNDVFLSLLGAKGEILHLSSNYLQIISIMLPAVFVKYVLVSGFNATGDTKTPFKTKLLSSSLNLFLNYILIFGHFGFEPLGVRGAAIATVVATFFELFIYFYIFFKTFFVEKLTYDKDFVRKVFKIGIPAGWERILTFGSYLLFTSIIARIGDSVLAGYQIGLRIEGLAFMPGVGFTIAAMSLVGQSIGAKNYQKAYTDAIHTLKIASVFMGSLGIVMILFPQFLSSFFTNDQNVIKQSSLYLQIIGFSQIPLAFTFVLSGSIRGLGKTKTTLKINLFSLFAVLLTGW